MSLYFPQVFSIVFPQVNNAIHSSFLSTILKISTASDGIVECDVVYVCFMIRNITKHSQTCILDIAEDFCTSVDGKFIFLINVKRFGTSKVTKFNLTASGMSILLGIWVYLGLSASSIYAELQDLAAENWTICGWHLWIIIFLLSNDIQANVLPTLGPPQLKWMFKKLSPSCDQAASASPSTNHPSSQWCSKHNLTTLTELWDDAPWLWVENYHIVWKPLLFREVDHEKLICSTIIGKMWKGDKKTWPWRKAYINVCVFCMV